MKAVIYALATLLVSSVSHAVICKTRVQGNTAWIQFGAHGNALKIKDLFDAENADSSLFALVEKADLAALNAAGKLRTISFSSIPSKTTNDPRCKDKSVTGYVCRDIQLKDSIGIPMGIDAAIDVSVSSERAQYLDLIKAKLNCESSPQDNSAAAAPAVSMEQLQATPSAQGQCVITSHSKASWITIQDGEYKRLLKIQEVLEAMDKNPQLLTDLKAVGAYGLKNVESVKINFDKIPARTTNDPKCENSSVTEFKCFDRKLKEEFKLYDGIKGTLSISVPRGNEAALQRVIQSLGCESGKPAVAAAQQPTAKKTAQ